MEPHDGPQGGPQNESQSPPPFRVEFERSGGFAGMRLAAVIDSRDLPPAEARRLAENLAAAGFFALPAKPAPFPGGADYFTYRITVEQGGQKHSVELSDPAVSEAAWPLIRQLTVLARQKGKNLPG